MFLLSVHLLILCITNSIYGLDNGLARTPPMGWMTWQRFRCQTDCLNYPDDCISERLIKRTADKLVSDGWRDAGYRYLIIDDCWAAKERDPVTKEIVPDPNRFSHDLATLGEFIHSRGLLFGIYLDYGTLTCAGYPGSLNYLEIDAQSVAKWGADYVKMDGCNANESTYADGYEKFGKLLNATNRPIVFSCSYPAYIGWYKNPKLVDWSRLQKNCNLWRMLGDVQDAWWSVLSIINSYKTQNATLAELGGPGHWNDPDMLLLGNYGLSQEQQRVQMGMWCMFAAPLIMSVDLDTMDEFSESLLKNPHLLAIDQDRGGHQAIYIKTEGKVQFWTRRLESDPSGWAIACLNTDDGGGPIHLITSLDEFLFTRDRDSGSVYDMVDVFNGTRILRVSAKQEILLKINPSSIVMYRIQEIKSTDFGYIFPAWWPIL